MTDYTGATSFNITSGRYSNERVSTTIATKISALKDGTPIEFDTLKELADAVVTKSNLEQPSFTGHVYSPEYRATGTGHLKLRAETGNDLNIYLAGSETLQITRDPSTGDCKFTAGGGAKAFKFNQSVNLDGGFSIGGVAVTATAAELNYMDGVTSNVQTQIAGNAAAIVANASIASAGLALKSPIDNPTFTTKIESPEYHSVGTGHLKFRGGGNDIIFYPQDTETLQITRSGTDCRFTSNGGTGTFKFNQQTDLAGGMKLSGTAVTATAAEINGWEARIASLEAQLTLLQE